MHSVEDISNIIKNIHTVMQSNAADRGHSITIASIDGTSERVIFVFFSCFFSGCM